MYIEIGVRAEIADGPANDRKKYYENQKKILHVLMMFPLSFI